MSILNPKEFAEKYVKGYVESDLSPNGLDVRIKDIFLMDDTTPGQLEGPKRKFPKRIKVEPTDGNYILFPHKTYEVTADLQITIPSDAAGWLVPRSSFLRCGVLAMSGVYDSGFSGGINLFLMVGPCLVGLGLNEKVAQLVMFDAKAYKQYDGYFQGTINTAEAQARAENKP
jgi:dUTP pyrophosphatase